MIDLKAIRDKVESLPINSSFETNLCRCRDRVELIVRLWPEDESKSVMTSYSMSNYGRNRIFTIFDNECENIYENDLTTEEVLERLKSNLSERGINYDNI